jgi:syntaxin 5
MIDSSPLYAPERRGDSTRGSQDFVSISIPQQQQQQMQHIDQRDTYLDSRAEAIEGIEKTINELGSIFQQLTSMISAHDDLVRRFVFQHTKILCKMLFFSIHIESIIT